VSSVLSVLVTILAIGGFAVVSWLGYRFGCWMLNASRRQPELMLLVPERQLSVAEQAAYEEYRLALNHYHHAVGDLLAAAQRFKNELHRDRQ
jgi:hypothetical protein